VKDEHTVEPFAACAEAGEVGAESLFSTRVLGCTEYEQSLARWFR